MEEIIKKIQIALKQALSLQFILRMRKHPLKSDAIYEMAIFLMGEDLSDHAPDPLGCADAVNEVVYRAIGKEIGGGISTYRMYEVLQDRKRFVQVSAPIAGDIVISPTGYRKFNSKIKNGHVGIVGEDKRILSNNSRTGEWDDYYTLDTWKARYVETGGYPMEFYKVI